MRFFNIKWGKVSITAGVLDYNFSRKIKKKPLLEALQILEWFFSEFMENESERRTNTSSENRFAVHAIFFSRDPIHFHEPRKKTRIP